MYRLILVLSAIMLTGCASSPWGTSASGGANYSYEKTINATTGDTSCKVTVNSARDLQGAQLKIGKDCQMTSGLDSTSGVAEGIAAFSGVMKDVISKIPDPVTP